MTRQTTPPTLRLFDPTAPAACRHTVSAGGGLARQFRVQSRTPGGDGWHVERVFAVLADAESFLRGRPGDGRETRIVRCGVSPVAA